MAKNGQKFTPFQQLQANSLQITKKHMMKLPGMKKTVFWQSNPTGWTLSAQRFRRYSILKLGSQPKYLIFCKKIKKLAQFHRFHSQYLSLIQFVTCPVSYQASTQGPIDNEYLKIQKKLATIGQKRLQNYAHPAIASK